jgi:hypothetical protein
MSFEDQNLLAIESWRAACKYACVYVLERLVAPLCMPLCFRRISLLLSAFPGPIIMDTFALLQAQASCIHGWPPHNEHQEALQRQQRHRFP